MTVAFVLGGGGVRGATEVGMLRALLDAGIVPDLVVGTSIGAINGAAVAQDPTPAVVERLEKAWASPTAGTIYGTSWYRQARRLAKHRTHLNDPAPLRALVEGVVGAGTRFEDLAVPLAVCAASIERAAEHWFDSGPVVDAVLASSAVPAALPPMRIGDEHFIDGGIVNSIPLGEAVARGATTIFVLQVGRIEEPLTAPEKPTDVAKVAFEVARRHRFQRDRAAVPAHVDLHVLPYGGPQEGDQRLGAFRSLERTHARIEAAREASSAYLVLAGLV
ncbi:patatin-like phospholipase family protein [Demequina lignilytica]|uniref:Patatin-like phospholipase family protein n=1 Tax=Demequina lignilytica TaxID=3051663 RepID=A0AB35MJ22_9MICO|nr:patatin-like phospholipase family protein [Demequina sp. SYSU T0a273]MDN4483784.1 patatin-like phospholipase family protein [Demequina sp. SYSU T0a273]